MADAEEKQFQSKPITDWLGKLKDVTYDAEDVVDDFNLEALQARRKKVHNFCFCFCLKKVAFRHEIGNRIQDIRKRLDEIAKQRDQFHLSEMSVARPIQIRQAPYTSPLIDPSTVIGREEEKDKLIEGLLMSNKSIREKHFSVIPIQGLGGLGKTTLARFVYDNEEVKKHFEVRGWVCAFDKFDSRRVTKEIVESIIREKCKGIHPEDSLKNVIDGKRFFIVIDDVWEDVLKYWDDFHIPFIHGNQGSKLIVTTRSEKVSSFIGTSFPLVGLPDEDCFKLFLRKTFVKGDEERYPNLVEIGEKIVKKCGGVPLAINTLSGLLTFTRNESEWKGVLKSSFWELTQDENSILPALRLSYHHLPPKVKPCFAFCSLFPKDWIFEKDVLIRMWMALGYIQPNEWREEENVGEAYFNDLLMRSFFSRDPEVKNEFTMHDLIHDLAESLHKEECIKLHSDKSVFAIERLYNVVDGEEAKEVGLKNKQLRELTLSWTHEEARDGSKDEVVLENLQPHINLERLMLRDYQGTYLPSWLSNLRSLRGLRLMFCSKQASLPEDLGKLEELWLCGCHNISCLTRCGLPKSLRKLVIMDSPLLKESWEIINGGDSAKKLHIPYVIIL